MLKDVHPEEQNLERNKTESSVEPCKKESVELSETQIYSNSESSMTTMRFLKKFLSLLQACNFATHQLFPWCDEQWNKTIIKPKNVSVLGRN